MDESLWDLFWATGLPEAYALAKVVRREIEREQAEQSA